VDHCQRLGPLRQRCGRVSGLDGLDATSPHGAAAQQSLASSKAIYNSQEPAQMLGNLEGISVGAAFILKDLHRHMDEPVVVRRLRDVGQKFSENRRTIILTSPKIEIPPELKGLVEFLELPLPDRRRLRQIIDEVVVEFPRPHACSGSSMPKGMKRWSESLRGLTEEEAERALSQALVARYACARKLQAMCSRPRNLCSGALRCWSLWRLTKLFPAWAEWTI
jgi:hypothetical protein